MVVLPSFSSDSCVAVQDAIDIKKGMTAEQAKKMATRLGFKGPAIEDAATQMMGLYKMFIGTDSTQVEINPFVLAKDGKGMCILSWLRSFIRVAV